MSARRLGPPAGPPPAPFVGVGPPELRSVEEVITTTLRDAIRRGDLRPGDRLPQERLAEQLHVSRIPLRDALRRLEVERLVRIDPHRGAEVVALEPADVVEIYEILALLEEPAMRWAIRDLDEEGAARLIEMSDRMDAVLGDPATDSEALRAFYAELYLHAKRSRLTITIMRLRDSVQRYHVLKRSAAALHAHASLRGALRARDADAAVRTHLAHMRAIRDDLVAALERDRPARAEGEEERDAGNAAVDAEPRTPSVEETVTLALRDRILSGEIAPGSRLLQDRLATGFGVSRIPLRDALRRLEVEGLVRIDPRRGAYVAELSVGDVQEIYELRALLEPLCLRHAVRAIDDDGIERIIAMSVAMERPAATAVEGRARRRAFYATLYAYARKPRLVELIMRLRDDVYRYHVIQHDDAHGAHAELRDRIRARDADDAARILGRHLRRAGTDLLAVLAARKA